MKGSALLALAPPALYHHHLTSSPYYHHLGVQPKSDTRDSIPLKAFIDAVMHIIITYYYTTTSIYLPPLLSSRYEVRESSTGRPTRDLGIDYGFFSTVDAKERRQGTRDVGYGIRDTWVDPAEDLYALLEDAQDSRSRISQRVDMDSQWVDLLMGDRMTLQETVWMVEEEAYALRGMGSLDILTAGLLIQTQYQVHETPLSMQQVELVALRRLTAAREVDSQEEARDSDHQGTEGVVGLTRWIEKMESVFNISGCAIENQVKFATCTLLGAALTWWNGQIRTLGPEAYAMTWEVLKKKMTDKYCPQGEIKKLEIELWNLKVKGNDVPAYTERFQELTLICTKFVANETEKVDKYISGLPDNIYGNVKSARPKTLDETIELANDLMDQKLRTYAERVSIWGQAKELMGDFAKVHTCHLHHMAVPEMPQVQKSRAFCSRLQRVWYQMCNTRRAMRQLNGNGCFECGAPGHFKRDCLKLKNKDGGNRNAQGWVYAVRNAEKRGT
ncbi:putative reverse transcriptase domain-containing protein [Tanacetum coccineum]